MGTYPPYTFHFDNFDFDTFKSVVFKKKFLIDFLDELGNFKQKKFYTFFENDTFESVWVSAHSLYVVNYPML